MPGVIDNALRFVRRFSTSPHSRSLAGYERGSEHQWQPFLQHLSLRDLALQLEIKNLQQLRICKVFKRKASS